MDREAACLVSPSSALPMAFEGCSPMRESACSAFGLSDWARILDPSGTGKDLVRILSLEYCYY